MTPLMLERLHGAIDVVVVEVLNAGHSFDSRIALVDLVEHIEESAVKRGRRAGRKERQAMVDDAAAIGGRK